MADLEQMPPGTEHTALSPHLINGVPRRCGIIRKARQDAVHRTEITTAVPKAGLNRVIEILSPRQTRDIGCRNRLAHNHPNHRPGASAVQVGDDTSDDGLKTASPGSHHAFILDNLVFTIPASLRNPPLGILSSKSWGPVHSAAGPGNGKVQ